MNDKEIKAIELLKKIRFSSDEYYIVDGAYAKNIDYMLILNAIETVLNLIEKQQAEIEKKKERIKYLERSISRKEHSLVEEEQDNVELETKLQEKDNIIDLMAEQLVKAHEWFYSEFDNYTKEDFIEYFENKVKESK